MSRSKLLWCLKLLGCILLVFVVINVSGPLRNLLWWMLHNAGRTNEPRGLFNTNSYLPFCAVCGAILGTFPLHLVSDCLNAILGRLHRQPAKTINERDFSRPIMWTWAPFAMIWLPKFLLYQSSEKSVFGTIEGISRWDFFFGNDLLTSLRIDQFMYSWTMTRILLTGPMLLAITYALAVVIRVKMEERRNATHVEQNENEFESNL